MRLLLTLALLPLAGCVTDRMTPEEELADVIGDRVAQAPVDCVSTAVLDQPRIIDNRTIVYRRTGTIYVNRLRSECPGLDPYTTLITEVRGGQLCRHDLVSTLDPGGTIPGPKCQLGEFVPYELPE
ncbi:hypothetical protein D1610_13935 [Sphingomonas gilva]|uniref:Uncharacterized protein n=1 Tax=Sphingomonas gilva TaxID=2305907 RepID=A0A396RKS3_9SPHN|nr:hypothetical protein [Sphingomonas gilva]RHW16820.1 hypothetical protein D1610_13935 [Sphingomonas gilva]